MDPSEQVPESVVQTISQKVEQELTKKFEEQKADLVHGFAELLTETLGQTIDPAAIARLIALTRSPEQGGSVRNHDHPRSSASSYQPRNEGVRFAHWIGVSMVEFKSDAKVVLDDLAFEGESLSLINHICAVIKMEAASFTPKRFLLIHKEGNKVAYSLANVSAHNVSLNLWLDSCPEFLLSKIQADLNYL
ncbi:uncharacterized protein A4U43_C05F20710 [Asparagus officinalis]|uniref:RNase H type-1 domain-containing protein n=1 Tax=Asparagus officinalis TaxID=4686 RepID=A0A5P1ETB5_ASPOF|nr:uncharacterized protein A4U43_C05F20710 [Asparagus officinalis]